VTLPTSAPAPAAPLPAYNFSVIVAGATMGFRDVAGLAVVNETVTYEHGMSFREGPRMALRPDLGWKPVTLRRGSVASLRALSDWMSQRDSRTVQVSLLDSGGIPTLTWVAERAVPVQLDASDFDATTNDVAIETLSLLVSGVRVTRP
jgi:phage tail-like protein